MNICGRCNKTFGTLETMYSPKIVYDELHYKVSLNKMQPNNPYKDEFLCRRCYQELWEKGVSAEEMSTSQQENTVDISSMSGMIQASKILDDFSILVGLKDKYLVIYDQALTGLKFDNLNKAINVMAKKGWKCINITAYNISGQIFSQAIYMFALMEKLA